METNVDYTDLYINLLWQARADQQSGTPISIPDFEKRLPEKLKSFLDAYFADIYGNFPGSEDNFMNMDAYTKLIEFEEFQHSFSESKKASESARTAICLTGSAILVQLITWVLYKLV